MADVLVRHVPDGVVAAIDADARRQGLSRSEYLRRVLERTARFRGGSVTVEDLSRFAGTFADLADPCAMEEAWESPG
ncbi:antitoxin [Nocardiopsis sp. TSRI0078]|uniref:type II toxin-antitoxin system VapB family antitoxin n=1 Tax=unclassified Nocardiopsis TaxID=2649073 RepID=UPI000939218E|nr:ribbon-helix-helix domain-containing protein [Nocardiopsis sp. TSRI0078]OKI13614.1 antitoxin [Nocardiopsis sp. TSRI0078]